MSGLDESDDEEHSGKGRSKRKRGADDLDDDFEETPDYDVLGAGLEGTPASQDQDEESSGNDDDEDTSEGDLEQSEGEGEEGGEGGSEFDGAAEDCSGEGEHEQLATPSLIANIKTMGEQPANQELPFTFPCPANHDEFLAILENVEDQDVPTVIQRIRALYHTSLGADNKFKLQVRANSQSSAVPTHQSLLIRHLQ
jgi:nucleolar protein 14